MVDMDFDWNDRLTAIAEDHRAPSSALATRAAELLRDVGREDPELFAEVARGVVAAQPAMAALVNVANVALRAVEVLGLDSIGKALDTLREGIDADRRAAAAAICTHVTEPVTLVTTSASGNVVEVVQQLRRRQLLRGVVCSESRPLLEGTALARWFAEQEIETTLVTDAGLADYLESGCIFVVGADAILPNHVVNKRGTRVFAAWAQLAGVPRFVAATRDKVYPQELVPVFANPSRAAEELMREPPAALHVDNRAFDLSPRRAWTAIYVGKQSVDVAEGLGDHGLARGLQPLSQQASRPDATAQRSHD